MIAEAPVHVDTFLVQCVILGWTLWWVDLWIDPDQ